MISRNSDVIAALRKRIIESRPELDNLAFTDDVLERILCEVCFGGLPKDLRMAAVVDMEMQDKAIAKMTGKS